MLTSVKLLVAAHLLTSFTHPVDFELVPTPPAPLPSATSPTLEKNLHAQAEKSAGLRYSIARGFGNGIPLGFAVKQMVPATFRVFFLKDVDLSTMVSWSGGRPWNEALEAALQQRGLKMVVIDQTVTIAN